MYINYLVFVLCNFGPRHRWEVDIKMGLNEIGWGGHGLGWCGLDGAHSGLLWTW